MKGRGNHFISIASITGSRYGSGIFIWSNTAPEMKTMDHFTAFAMRSLSLLAFVVLFSMGAVVKAQDVAFWTFERVDGPVAPVAKLVSVILPELDPQVLISHSGSQLKVRIDRSVTEAVLLQKLQEGTGGPFRSLRSHNVQQEPAANSAIAGQVLSKYAFVDLAANLAEQPELLNEYGIPVLVTNANEQEREAHHALIKSWLSAHPEQQSVILQTLMEHEDAE